MFLSMSSPRRFVVWLLLALPVTLGAGALGYFIPDSGHKIYLAAALQFACNLLSGWLLGLVCFRNGSEIGTSILVILLALAMPPILIVFAIISTLFCGIDACGS